MPVVATCGLCQRQIRTRSATLYNCKTWRKKWAKQQTNKRLTVPILCWNFEITHCNQPLILETIYSGSLHPSSKSNWVGATWQLTIWLPWIFTHTLVFKLGNCFVSQMSAIAIHQWNLRIRVILHFLRFSQKYSIWSRSIFTCLPKIKQNVPDAETQICRWKKGVAWKTDWD